MNSNVLRCSWVTAQRRFGKRCSATGGGRGVVGGEGTPTKGQTTRDVVPVLVRSKPAVIDFFVGAGVPNKHLGDWKLKVDQDKNSVNKYQIARSVLCRLNDADEPTLTVRREIIKHVSEFEDFSSCWDNDRLKAQALVGQIQKLVNVKDSFTRMKLERERERKERQATYTASVQAKQNEAEQRAAIRESLSNFSRRRIPTSAESSLRPS